MELDQVALHGLKQVLYSFCLRERKKGASSKSQFLSAPAVCVAAAAAPCTTSSCWLFTARPVTVDAHFPPCIRSEPQLHPAATQQKWFRQHSSNTFPNPAIPFTATQGRRAGNCGVGFLRNPSPSLHPALPPPRGRDSVRAENPPTRYVTLCNTGSCERAIRLDNTYMCKYARRRPQG